MQKTIRDFTELLPREVFIKSDNDARILAYKEIFGVPPIGVQSIDADVNYGMTVRGPLMAGSNLSIYNTEYIPKPLEEPTSENIEKRTYDILNGFSCERVEVRTLSDEGLDKIVRVISKQNERIQLEFIPKDWGAFVNECRPIMMHSNNHIFFIDYDNQAMFTISCLESCDIYHNRRFKCGQDVLKVLSPMFWFYYGEKTSLKKMYDFVFKYFKIQVNPYNSKGVTYMYYAMYNRMTDTVDTQAMTVVPKDSPDTIKTNYNDDLPYDAIKTFLHDKDASGICLFHGEPGTGKSTFLKELVALHDELQFYYLPVSILRNLSENTLNNFFINKRHNAAAYIVEDCESVLMDRSRCDNPLLSSILNFSDGILGDVVHPKFLMTFNGNPSSIDKAVLRKGRLKVKYEFKKLCLEKCKAIYPDAKEPMTLADLYNLAPNGVETANKKIGF